MSGLRERKKADTRRALSDAALSLALERGFEAVTREAIADRAGVSLRTFTNYFAGKYEALAYRQTQRMRRSVAEFRRRPADEPLWTAIAEAVVGTLETDSTDITGIDDRVPTRAELIEIRRLLAMPGIRDAVSRDLFDDWAQAIAERTGARPDDLYPRLVVAVVRAVGDATMEAYASADPPVAITELMRTGFAAVAAGLPVPDGANRDD